LQFSPAEDDTTGILKIRRQRDQIYRYFGEVIAQADAVPFETGPTRAGHMAARDRIRRWQTALRTFYLLHMPLLQFRVYATARQKATLFAKIDNNFREECARAFQYIADCLEGQLEEQAYAGVASCSLRSLLSASLPGETADLSEREIALLRILKTLASIVDRMQQEVAAEALYATE
jgi:multidrug resistance protein MdtO